MVCSKEDKGLTKNVVFFSISAACNPWGVCIKQHTSSTPPLNRLNVNDLYVSAAHNLLLFSELHNIGKLRNKDPKSLASPKKIVSRENIFSDFFIL